MDWLEVQLSEFRERGMQVWLSGHVPPHLGVYFDNCCELPHAVEPELMADLRYGDLALRYQDTIVGHLYGHMCVDFLWPTRSPADVQEHRPLLLHRRGGIGSDQDLCTEGKHVRLARV